MLLSIAHIGPEEKSSGPFLQTLINNGGNKMSMKLNKSTAGVTAPDAGSTGLGSEGQAASANAVIIVGFAEIEVYGLNGGTWSLIDTVDSFLDSVDDGTVSDGFFDNTAHSYGVNPDHTTVNLADYEDVFFVSKSGQEETVRYFFVDDAVVAPHILDGNQPDTLKLEDISDVPAFTQADAGKILSVDAQGNLAWIAR